jgi:hypothetical protein
MDRKQLAELYEKKMAEAARRASEKHAQLDAQRAASERKEEEGRTKLRDTIIPFLRNTMSEFPKGEFKLDQMIDRSTNDPIRVSFKIGNGYQYFIEVVRGGNIAAGYKVPRRTFSAEFAKTEKSENVEIERVVLYPGIVEPRDLTPQKLTKLLEFSIEQLSGT